jgi:hypothetical protein
MDKEPESPSLEDLEKTRQDAFRVFRIRLTDNTWRAVFAHFWDNTNTPGHLNFYTIAPSGRITIRHSFSARLWVEVQEVEDMKTDKASVKIGSMKGVH